MKKVLIAIDYNSTAQEVAKAGYALAKAMNAEVTLLHVVADYTYYSSLDYSPILGFDSFSNLGVIQTATITELHNAAEEYLHAMKNQLGGSEIATLVKEGDTGDSILEAIKETQADLVVIGTHGRKGIEKMFLGSVAEKVLRHSTVPMYIIPAKKTEDKQKG